MKRRVVITGLGTVNPIGNKRKRRFAVCSRLIGFYVGKLKRKLSPFPEAIRSLLIPILHWMIAVTTQ